MRTYKSAVDLYNYPDCCKSFYCNSNDETGPSPSLGGIGAPLSSLGVPTNGIQHLKDEPLFRCCDSNLNFATVACSEDDSEFGQFKKNKVSRQDPMSHRIIEKRRRDRMNNCLADLSRLIPADYLKKGRGRIEKTEIIEMAIKHIKYLQQLHQNNNEETDRSSKNDQYRLGYQECMSETMRFLVEVEGYFAREALCVRLINHLQKHCDDLLQERMPNTNQTSETDYAHMQSVPNIINSPNRSNPVVNLNSPQNDYENNIKDLNQEIKNEINETTVRSDVGIYDDKNYEIVHNLKKDDIPKMDQNRDYNNVSLYKFKNNIKQRFSQDVSAETQKVFKRRKLSEPIRRTSITLDTYGENNSPNDGSSQYSPPSSEFRVSSESESRISPTGSSVSDNRNRPYIKDQKSNYGRHSPINKYQIKTSNDIEKTNFGVPIFALHAKGSFYIPLTIDYNTLVPFLQHHNVLDVLPNVHNIILHPVTINVNFQSNYFNSVLNRTVRTKKVENSNGWH